MGRAAAAAAAVSAAAAAAAAICSVLFQCALLPLPYRRWRLISCYYDAFYDIEVARFRYLFIFRVT